MNIDSHSEAGCRFGTWAREVRGVSDMPDLWEELKRAPEILAAVQQEEASNAPFTVAAASAPRRGAVRLAFAR